MYKTFKHVETDYKGDLKEKRVNHKRHYLTPHGKVYPSVTTVTSILNKDSIQKWRDDVGEAKADYIMVQAQINGTEFHSMCEDYLNNKSLSNYKNLVPKAHFNNIKEYLDKIDNIHGLETRLYSDELELAGKTDCIAEYDGQSSIIDFKTSRKEKKAEWIVDYFIQATAYSLMWLERTKLDFQQIVIIVSGLDGSKEVFKRNRNEYIDDLKETVKLWKQHNKS